MKFAKTLSRDEMKSVMAGRVNDCGIACNNFGSDCYEACHDAFNPDDDLFNYCNRTCKTQVDYCMEPCFE